MATDPLPTIPGEDVPLEHDQGSQEPKEDAAIMGGRQEETQGAQEENRTERIKIRNVKTLKRAMRTKSR